MSTDIIAVPAGAGVVAESASSALVESRVIADMPSLAAALADGLDRQWRGVIESDPLATLFQSPGWCMPWYRAYADTFDPYVIVVSCDDRVVGIVPLAVERSSRRLVFATDSTADYRDIVARPGYRRQVAAEMIRHYVEGGFPGPLQVGWLDPGSDTAALVSALCAKRRLRCTERRQPCWRWSPPAPAKPSAQKFLNWYKRNGEVSFDVIETDPAWETFRDQYYRQHSLRQIQAGRAKAFEDPRKLAVYDALFHSEDIQTHVTAFSVDGQMLAGHFGYVWRGVLLLGPPSIHLEHEQRSPAVILLSWIIQNAEALGLKGFDLTIGESDFKKRLGNQCVELTMIEVYGSAFSYYIEATRAAALTATKNLVTRAGGPDAWRTLVKPATAAITFERARLAEMPRAAMAAAIARAAARLIYDPAAVHTYSITADTLCGEAPASLGAVHENVIDDLLLWNGASASAERAMTDCARNYARLRAAGHSLHTLVVDGGLAGWCYSSDTTIRDGFIMPGFHQTAAAETLVREVARRRLAAGARELRATSGAEDAMLKRALEAHGCLVDTTTAPRLFGSERLFDRISRLWRRLTWRAIRRRLALAYHYAAEERMYRLAAADAADLPASTDFARDRWEDLERFVPSEPRHTREACLADWRQRRARGEHVYTRVEDGRLAAYGWMVERQKTIRLDWVDETASLPDNSAGIYDFYTLPEYRHRDFYQRLLMHAMQDAARIPGTEWIYLSILASDTVPRWWVERLGMEFCGGYEYSRTLWRRTRRAIPTSISTPSNG